MNPKSEKSAARFHLRVLSVVRGIAKGKTMTYKEVAYRCGNSRAARAVGAILKWNYDPEIPCHRVIRSDGKTGGYNRGVRRKLALLRKEGALDRSR